MGNLTRIKYWVLMSPFIAVGAVFLERWFGGGSGVDAFLGHFIIVIGTGVTHYVLRDVQETKESEK